ncbi:MAG: nuclear transport factor 2 family protein [Proteobacteria bacterium]|nr:nuclear transport factor 2 family protein [Pseudomonadota bacterium]
MSATQIGTQLVSLCNDGKSLEAVDQLYAKDVVSIEGQGSDEIPARMEGFDAVRGKSVWWLGAHDVHTMKATGPFCGHREDQFVVHFEIDVTTKETGERSQMSEVGIYTTANGKVVQEEFLYQMG